MKKAIVPFLALALFAASCGGSGSDGSRESGSDESVTTQSNTGVSESDDSAGGEPSGEPIKIGAVSTNSGPLAVYGESVFQGVEYAVADINAKGGVLGRPVELIKGETDGTPESSLQAVERIIQQDGAQFVTGPITSAEVLAILPRLESLDTVFMNLTSQSPDVTGAACSARAFQVTTSNPMDLAAMNSAIVDSGATKWAVLAWDFTIGHDSVDSFTAAATGAGHEVLEPLFSPPGTDDYGTYITQIQESGADALWLTVIGGGAIAFMNQADQFGLFDEIDIVMGTNTVNEPVFPALGEYIEGFVGPVGYYRTALDTPANDAFVTGWEEAYGDLPYFVDADSYTGMMVLFQGIEAAGTDDPAAVAEALEGLEVDTLFGSVVMRAEDHQLLRPTFAGKVVTGDDGLAWEVVSIGDAATTTPAPNPDCTQ